MTPAASPAARPNRGLLIGLGVLAGILFLVGILGFALGGGGDDSAKVDRLERKEARLKDSLEATRSATSAAEDVTNGLSDAESSFFSSDDEADSTFNDGIDLVNTGIERANNEGGPVAFGGAEYDQMLQGLNDKAAADQAALDELHQRLAAAQELLK